MILLITVLSLAPGIPITITCFPFLVTVLSILRQALGLQQAPPNMLIVSLALFLTWFIMEPVMTESWSAGISPLIEERLTVEEALPRAVDPFRGFMANRMDVDTFEAMAALRPEADQIETGPGAPLSVLIPSFMLSEIARAFQIGFLLFLPFPDHRPGGGGGADVDGDDDGAPGDRVAAIQTVLLRHRRWLDAAGLQPGAQLRLSVGMVERNPASGPLCAGPRGD